MSKRKKNDEEVKASQEAFAVPDQIEEAALVIDSEESAKKFYQEAKYSAPEGVEFAYVTSDRNVFWPNNGGSAKAHAFQNNLKIFKIKVNGLIESND